MRTSPYQKPQSRWTANELGVNPSSDSSTWVTSLATMSGFGGYFKQLWQPDKDALLALVSGRPVRGAPIGCAPLRPVTCPSYPGGGNRIAPGRPDLPRRLSLWQRQAAPRTPVPSWQYKAHEDSQPGRSSFCPRVGMVLAPWDRRKICCDHDGLYGRPQL